jgi:hypothetical protein
MRGHHVHLAGPVLLQHLQQYQVSYIRFLFSSHPVLRIGDVYPASESFPSRIQDKKDSESRIRIRIKEFKYFEPKNLFLSSRKYDPGCSSRIRILIFLPIPDPGSRGQKGTGSQIPNSDPQHCC